MKNLSSTTFWFFAVIGLLIGDAGIAYAISSESYARVADWPYTSPYRMGNEDLSKVEKEIRLSRTAQFDRMFRLVIGDRRYENWPGRRKSECVPPLFGVWSNANLSAWTDRCVSLVGETEAVYTFAFNAYQRSNTLQHIVITVPGHDWKLKKSLMDKVQPVLGKPVPTLPKGSPKGAPLVWRWKAGKGQATLYEEFSPQHQAKVTRFVWYRPAEAPKRTKIVTKPNLKRNAAASLRTSPNRS